jgi:hypothetical protein
MIHIFTFFYCRCESAQRAWIPRAVKVIRKIENICAWSRSMKLEELKILAQTKRLFIYKLTFAKAENHLKTNLKVSVKKSNVLNCFCWINKISLDKRLFFILFIALKQFWRSLTTSIFQSDSISMYVHQNAETAQYVNERWFFG